MSRTPHTPSEQQLLIDADLPLAGFARDEPTGWYLSPLPRRLAVSFEGSIRPEDLRPGLRLAVLMDWQVLQGKRWRHVRILEMEYAYEAAPPSPDGVLQINDRPVVETPLAFSELLARAPRSDRAGGARGPWAARR